MAWRAAQDIARAITSTSASASRRWSAITCQGIAKLSTVWNGILGIGGKPEPGKEDPFMVDAGKKVTTLVAGGCFVHHNDAFLMIRGGHLDLSLLPSKCAKGDLANWTTEDPGFPPGVGGAMDLAVGARQIRVMMDHTSQEG